jgi:hypothetical protein
MSVVVSSIGLGDGWTSAREIVVEESIVRAVTVLDVERDAHRDGGTDGGADRRRRRSSAGRQRLTGDVHRPRA